MPFAPPLPPPRFYSAKAAFQFQASCTVQAVFFSLVLPPQAVLLIMSCPMSHPLACTAAASATYSSNLRTNNAVMLACTWKDSAVCPPVAQQALCFNLAGTCFTSCFRLLGTLLLFNRRPAASYLAPCFRLIGTLFQVVGHPASSLGTLLLFDRHLASSCLAPCFKLFGTLHHVGGHVASR